MIFAYTAPELKGAEAPGGAADAHASEVHK